MEGGRWRVVGGGRAGGLVVRAERALGSQAAAGRLGTGALVRQLGLDGDRLRFELLAGRGPATGWVSLRASGRELLVPVATAVQEDVPDQLAEDTLVPSLPQGVWHEILGVSAGASCDEVRKSFHRLALLHHPDKSPDRDDNGEAFRRLQAAYEDGLREAQAHNMDLAAADAEPDMRVPLSAPTARLRQACDLFEHRIDLGTTGTVPDEIPFVVVEQVAEWLLERACVPIDAREPSECYGNLAASLPGAVRLGYTQLLKRPETTLAELTRLQRFAAAGKRFVSFSTHGSTSNGNCAIVCCLLADVFGFDPERLCCLEDGYLMWRNWAASHVGAADQLRTIYGKL